jgi:small GTP-binding protein
VGASNQLNYNYMFKVIVVGEGGVGKTTLINRFATNKFSEDTKITIGASFYAFENDVNGSDAPVKLQVWDFGGEKRFRFILPSYCQGAHGVIFAFDLISLSVQKPIKSKEMVVNQSVKNILKNSGKRIICHLIYFLRQVH